VNALDAAKARGVAVEERRCEQIRDFSSMLTCQAWGGGHAVAVSGTLFGHRQPRLVKIDGCHLEALLEGLLLVVRNVDEPGVIGRLGSVLGAAGVNIQAMHLSPPRSDGDSALIVMNLAPSVAPATLAEIRALRGVHRADLVLLDRLESLRRRDSSGIQDS
jgi:hypothetical protein